VRSAAYKDLSTTGNVRPETHAGPGDAALRS
jgi:hypothetical protein